MALDPRTGEPWLGRRDRRRVRARRCARSRSPRSAPCAHAVEHPDRRRWAASSAARDALDLLRAGATLVAVGTESFRDPAAGARIAAELGRAAANGDVWAQRSTDLQPDDRLA